MNAFLRNRIVIWSVCGMLGGVAYGINRTDGLLFTTLYGVVGLIAGIGMGYWWAVLVSGNSREPRAPYAKPVERKQE